MRLYTYHHGSFHHFLKFLKRFLLWLFLVGLVVTACVAVAHGCQVYLGWSPDKTVEITMKMVIGAVGLVSWFLPSPLHESRGLRIPRMNSRQLSVLIVDDLKENGHLEEEQSVKATACVQNSIEDRLATPKVTVAR